MVFSIYLFEIKFVFKKIFLIPNSSRYFKSYHDRDLMFDTAQINLYKNTSFVICNVDEC